MKALLTVLVLFVYSVPVSGFLTISLLLSSELDNSQGFGPFIITVICMLIVCALAGISIIGAIISAIRKKGLSFRAVMISKLCLIPFYIINFICWGIASAVFHIAFIVWSLIPFIIAYTYLTMLGTSAHNMARLLTLRRSKSITTKQFVVHCILQAIFMIDIIDSIYLVIKQRSMTPQVTASAE